MLRCEWHKHQGKFLQYSNTAIQLSKVTHATDENECLHCFASILLFNISKIINQYSCWSCIHLSVATAGWLLIWALGKHQQKHFVKIVWRCGMYNILCLIYTKLYSIFIYYNCIEYLY